MAARGGAVTLTEPMPPEVGGQPIVDGAHKLGAYFAATADMHPRLEDKFGWLLYAFCGDVSTVADSPEAGLNTHYFRMDSSDYLAMKWSTIRRAIPAPESGAASGTQCLDARMASIMLNFPAAARVSARIGILGRVPTFSDDVSGWSYSASPEGPTSVPITSSTSAYFKLPTFQAANLPTQLCRVTLGNTVSQPQQEFIVGSPYPDDLIGLYRSGAIEAAYKWEDEDLYLQLVANGGTGASIDWDPTIYESSFQVKAVSGGDVSGFSNPYSLEVYAQKCYFWPTGAPEIAGVNIIQLPLAGIICRPDSGDAFQIRLVNEVASYTWPT